MTGDVDDFADEEQAGNFAAFHGFGEEFIGVDAAAGDFGFFEAFGACGDTVQACSLVLEIGQSERSSTRMGVVSRASGRRSGPAIVLRSSDRSVARVRGALGSSKDSCQLLIGCKVDADFLRLFPVGGDLQDRGAAQAAMSDQHFFAELLSVA